MMLIINVYSKLELDTLLIYAAVNSSKAMAKRLLERGVDTSDGDVDKALEGAEELDWSPLGLEGC